jgi:hypothetical protein
MSQYESQATDNGGRSSSDGPGRQAGLSKDEKNLLHPPQSGQTKEVFKDDAYDRKPTAC